MGAGASSPRDWVEEERRRGRASADPAAEEALRREFAGAGSSVRGDGAGPSGRGDGAAARGGGAGSTGARVYREHQGELLYVTKNRAKPHRCNDRVEDVIQAMFEGNPFLTVPPTVTLLRRCLNSEVGTEPEEPYLFLDLPAPTYGERRKRRGRRAGSGKARRVA